MSLRFFTKSYTFRALYWLLVLNWFDLSVILSQKRERASSKKKVAFVKMDGIGDLVIWSTLFDEIRGMYPSSEFERILIGNDRFKALVETENTFDQKIFVNLERFATSPIYRRSVLKQVRSENIDIIINARTTRDFLWSDSIVRCSGAGTRIGSEGIGNIMDPAVDKLTRSWYTELRPAPRPGDHELLSNRRFLGVSDPAMSISTDLATLRDVGSLVSDDYALFFVGAQSREKCWPAEKFGETACAVAASTGMKIVLCGGPDEQDLAAGFMKTFTGDPIELIGRSAVSLVDLAGLIKHARVVISNDTGAAHMAVVSRRPTVVVAPGNQAGRYFPYPSELSDSSLSDLRVIQHTGPCGRCDEHCIETWGTAKTTRPCLAEVSVDEVFDAIREVLPGSTEKRPGP